MKKKQLAVWMCVGVMMMAAGCTKTVLPEKDAAKTALSETKQETDGGSQTVNTEKMNAESEQQSEDKEKRNVASEGQTEELVSPANTDGNMNHDTKTASDELECDVISVDYNNKSVVVSEIFTETYDDGSQTAVSFVGGGGENAEQITVYFQDDINYTLKIIRDGGADVTTKEADFSDIQEGDILALKGKRAYTEESGDEFLSSEVTINRVILE